MKSFLRTVRDRWRALSYALGEGRRQRIRSIENPWVLQIIETVREVKRDDVSLMAAAVAYYAVLSFLPLFAAAWSILGLFAEDQRARDALEEFFSTYLPSAATEEIMGQLTSQSTISTGLLGILGFLGLLWSGTAMVSALAKAINRAYGIREDRPFYKARPRALLLGVSLFAAFGISIYSTAAIETASRFNVPVLGELTVLQWAARLPPLILTFVTFALIYQVLPNRDTQWRNTLPAAVLAALAFEIAKSAFVFYLNEHANYGDVYGSLASIIILMVWSYVSAFIVIVGAELAEVRAEIRREAGQHAPEEIPTGP